MGKKTYSTGVIFIIILFLLSAFVAWSQYFRLFLRKETVNIHLFPKQIDEWTSEELTITEDEYAILETRNALARSYQHPSGKEVYLLLVYSQYNRKVSHPPEVCLTGSGVSILSREVKPVLTDKKNQMVPVNRLLLKQGLTRSLSYYWFKVGDQWTASYWRQQILIALKTLTGQTASSALIRLSIQIKDSDQDTFEQDLQGFIQSILPELQQYLP